MYGRRRDNPYGEDESIQLPEGCIAEDVDLEIPDRVEPRALTYGLGTQGKGENEASDNNFSGAKCKPQSSICVVLHP
jgi:hypothetical protein